MIDVILDNTNKWESFQQSAMKFPQIFRQFDISIIEMWEVTGKLDVSIETIKKKEEKAQELKTKIIGALIYPCIIIFLATAMIVIFMVFVIPKIQKMYKDSKVNLPALTQVVIKVSEFLQNNVFLLILGCIGLGFLFSFLKSSPVTRPWFDRFVLRIPLFGSLIKKRILTTFTSSLGILLSSGVIINKSLEISSNSVENVYYQRAIDVISEGIKKWEDFSKLLGIDNIQTGKVSDLFPIELASAVKIGEQTWKLPELLIRLSIKFEKEIDVVVKNMQVMIEPLVIVFVGIIVWTLILAIMLPFFNMVNVI